jgi:hypothetical protein
VVAELEDVQDKGARCKVQGAGRRVQGARCKV